MRGRKPVPTRLHVLRGNPSKLSGLGAGDGVAPDAVATLEPPAWLTGAAREKWEQEAPKLARLGLLGDIDVDALASYCDTWVQFEQASRELALHGAVIVKRKVLDAQGKVIGGDLAPSPYVQIRHKALIHLRALGAEFGMTPSARARVHVTGGKKQSAAEKFKASAPKLRAV